MLNIKNLTLLSQKNGKKGGNFDHGCKKNRALFFATKCQKRFGFVLTKI